MSKAHDKIKARLDIRQKNWDSLSESEKAASTRPGSMNKRKWSMNRKKK